jgi:inward rectifier potassium channel
MADGEAKGSLPRFHARGERLAFHDDLYHVILRLSWSRYVAVVSGFFLLTNVAFAGLYALAPGSVQNASSFLDLFFFSVETLATIGYGTMAPQTHYAHAIVTIEALAGIAFTAVITGLTFVRFARPRAQILFTHRMVISKRNGVPHLMFRMANLRRNQLAEAQLNVVVLLTETTQEGEVMRKPVPLGLTRDRNPLFALSWTAMHAIDAGSPLSGNGLARMRDEQADIFCSLTGLDETLMQTIVARHRYSVNDIVENARFADIITMRDDRTRVIDYAHFHDIVRDE